MGALDGSPHDPFKIVRQRVVAATLYEMRMAASGELRAGANVQIHVVKL
jgi:hypothetical protein